MILRGADRARGVARWHRLLLYWQEVHNPKAALQHQDFLKSKTKLCLAFLFHNFATCRFFLCVRRGGGSSFSAQTSKDSIKSNKVGRQKAVLSASNDIQTKQSEDAFVTFYVLLQDLGICARPRYRHRCPLWFRRSWDSDTWSSSWYSVLSVFWAKQWQRAVVFFSHSVWGG